MDSAVPVGPEHCVPGAAAGRRVCVSRGQGLDASQPWLVYWAIHALDLLGVPLTPTQQHQYAPHVHSHTQPRRCIALLRQCQCPTGARMPLGMFVKQPGGFGGGPGQIAHLAPTYAAVNALVVIGTPDALSIVDRSETHFLLPCRTTCRMRRA